MKYKIGVGKVLMTVVLVLLALIFGVCFVCALSDIKWYSDALTVARSQQTADSIEVDQVEGKEPLKHDKTFDQNCYINQRYSYQSGTEWVGAAKALFDNTGLQLYNLVLTAPVGDPTDISNTADAKAYSNDFIDTLPNKDISIVLWEFSSETPEGEYISLYDNVIFGDVALAYLSTADMEMITYILHNDYDLFPDYETRDLRVWELISKNLSEGYNRNLYNSSTNIVTDWDLKYYREEANSAKVSAAVFGGLTLLLIVVSVIAFWVNFILIPKRIRAEEAIDRAHADRIILESDISTIPDESDELVDKYLGDD